MLKEARYLLVKEFENSYNLVKSSKPHAVFANEKLRHSLQVLGAGNYIIKHESYFLNKSADFLDLVKTAVLLHDIARFDEIVKIFHKPQSLDHGIMGWEKLKGITLFNDICITLPIKHHGHMIEDFYADAEYQDINDQELKDTIEKIIFVIRDADKIANLHLITNDLDFITPIFVPHLHEVSCQKREISQDYINGFYTHKTQIRKDAKTQADYMLYYICWLFDINFNTSINFCKKLSIIPKLFKQLQTYHDDIHLNDRLETEMNSFLVSKFGI